MITVAVIGIVAVLLAVQVKALKPEYGVYMSGRLPGFVFRHCRTPGAFG